MVAEDLARAGVSTSWGTGSDVEDEALAGRLARLRALVLKLGRLAEGAGAPAAHLSDALVVSDHSDDCADAPDHLAGIDPELPGLSIADEV
jgi:hypothetical protein